MNYFITISYDGGGYSGWQIQKNCVTVQGLLEEAAQKVFGERINVVGSGRTDAGVHAIGQAANFKAQKQIDIRKVPDALNFYLPPDVRVQSAKIVPDDFDARKSAKRKTYMYLMYKGGTLPVLENRAYRVGDNVTAQKITAVAKALIGRHDFSSFVSAGGGAKTFTRTVFDAHAEDMGSDICDGFIKFFITADGFLYNMVRIIVQKLVDICMTGESMQDVIEAKSREAAKGIAPAKGLYLLKADYGDCM